jgi:hypothetical protein
LPDRRLRSWQGRGQRRRGGALGLGEIGWWGRDRGWFRHDGRLRRAGWSRLSTAEAREALPHFRLVVEVPVLSGGIGGKRIKITVPDAFPGDAEEVFVLVVVIARIDLIGERVGVGEGGVVDGAAYRFGS